MKPPFAVVALLCTTGLLAACGGDDSPQEPEGTSSGSGQELKITAEEPGPGKYAFDPGSLDARAGAVTITLENPGSVQAPHSVAVEGNGVNESSDIVSPGKTATVTTDLKAGTYTFYCTVGDHRAEGMEGTLKVG